jgi:hypothetical protein
LKKAVVVPLPAVGEGRVRGFFNGLLGPERRGEAAERAVRYV